MAAPSRPAWDLVTARFRLHVRGLNTGMALWNLSNPPSWAPNAIATPKGWVNPNTGEVLVTIGSLDRRAGAAVIRDAVVVDNKGVYRTGDTFRLRVNFSEPVIVVGTPTIGMDIEDDLHASAVELSYASGSGTASLDFTYVLTGEIGFMLLPNPTTIGGAGSIHDAAPGDYGFPVDTNFVPPKPLPMSIA